MKGTTRHRYRILVIDDNPGIHEVIKDFLEAVVIHRSDSDELPELVAFDEEGGDINGFQVDSAFRGQNGYEQVLGAVQGNQPYALAFVDVRMPDGWDGLETVCHLWEADPSLQIVLCTAHSDHSWADIVSKLGQKDNLLVLKKPFDLVEVAQVSHALARKWFLQQRLSERLNRLEEMVRDRQRDLDETHRKLRGEMEERQRIESRLTQKPDDVGHLAAGMTHELQTSIQYVSDSVHFLDGLFKDLAILIAKYREAFARMSSSPEFWTLIEGVCAAEHQSTVMHLCDQIPPSFERTFEGLARVNDNVRAIKNGVYTPRTARHRPH